MEDVIKHIASAHSLKAEQLKGRYAAKYMLEAKHNAIYILAKFYNLKNIEIAKLLNTDSPKICRAKQKIEKKLGDPDFKQHIDGIVATLQGGADVDAFAYDLKKLEAMCTAEGDCLIINSQMIFHTSVAKKYNIYRANQLYFLLTTGQYAVGRMRPTCANPNCVRHWTTQDMDEFLGVNIPVEEVLSEVSPEEEFIYAMIKSAMEDKEVSYFKSKDFEYHLDLLGVTDKARVLSRIEESF